MPTDNFLRCRWHSSRETQSRSPSTLCYNPGLSCRNPQTAAHSVTQDWQSRRYNLILSCRNPQTAARSVTTQGTRWCSQASSATCCLILGCCSLLCKTRTGLGLQWCPLLLSDLFRIIVFVLDDVWSVSPHRDQNTPQPPCCDRSSSAQNAEWRSPRCGFSWCSTDPFAR